MERTNLLAALVRDGEAFARACDEAGADAPVASCPGWTVDDLLWHLTEVQHFWRWVLAERAVTPDAYVEPERPSGDALTTVYRSGLEALVTSLRDTPPDAAIWTWTSDHSAGWLVRRIAHETAVHRWDAEVAAGSPLAIDATLASDGIDEFLTWFLSPADHAEPVGGSVHIHCSDVAGEWTLRPTGDGFGNGFDMTREHAKGDCALRGSASDLLLTLWRRQPPSSIDVVGDADVAARFIAWPALS
ncbi:MAG: maleylpyruvate isomerase family mycothiol-dependent enzyme [Ilumatobacteraceae bacterium]